MGLISWVIALWDLKIGKQVDRRFKIMIVCCLIFFTLAAKGQISDSVASAIKTTLLDKKVSDKVFYYYDYKLRGFGHLGPGVYAFICPSIIFQKVYKGILDEFPYTDSVTYKVKFFKDETRSIYIDGSISFDLFLVFTEIYVLSDSATISFFTTSPFPMKIFKNNYVTVVANLDKINGRWEVTRCKIKSIKWVNFLNVKL